jgi:hypothetical protein
MLCSSRCLVLSRPPRVVALAVAVVAVAISGCGEESTDCTEMGCVPGASLTLPKALTEDGDYTLRVTVDGVTSTCTATLPLEGTGFDCEQGLFLLAEGPTTTTGSSVSQGPADRISGLWLDGKVGEVSVEVTRDGSVVYTGTATPAYEGVEINGPGCGECLQGSASLP